MKLEPHRSSDWPQARESLISFFAGIGRMCVRRASRRAGLDRWSLGAALLFGLTFVRCNSSSLPSADVSDLAPSFACASGTADCDHHRENGCEAATAHDPWNCGACGVTCPGERPHCRVGVCIGRPAALVLSNGAAAYFEDIQAKLGATGAFTAVDSLNLYNAAPDALLLSQYDAVLVWAFGVGQRADDAQAMILSYLQAGGRMVAADVGTFNPGWEFRQQMLTEPDGIRFSNYDNEGIGAIDEPDSPLLAGVHRVDFRSQAIAGLNLRNGGVVVARWRNGDPMVVRGTINGRRRVELNFTSISHDIDNVYGWTGDGAVLMKNALLYE